MRSDSNPRDWVLELRALWSAWRSCCRGRRRGALQVLVVGGLLSGGVAFFDERWLASVRELHTPALDLWFGRASALGRFEYLLVAMLLLLCAARLRRSERLADGVRALALAAAIAGVGAIVLRPAIGRSRPSYGTVDEFHVLALDHRFQSLPSGHAMTSSAAATALAVVVPPFGLPCLALASVIAISRVYRQRHWPSDVVFGCTLGGLLGWLAGRAVLLRRVQRTVDEGAGPGPGPDSA